jgi:hypothetical protein
MSCWHPRTATHHNDQNNTKKNLLNMIFDWSIHDLPIQVLYLYRTNMYISTFSLWIVRNHKFSSSTKIKSIVCVFYFPSSKRHIIYLCLASIDVRSICKYAYRTYLSSSRHRSARMFGIISNTNWIEFDSGWWSLRARGRPSVAPDSSHEGNTIEEHEGHW